MGVFAAGALSFTTIIWVGAQVQMSKRNKPQSILIFNSYKGSDVVFGAYGSWSYNIEDVGKENYCPRVTMGTAFATLNICWVEQPKPNNWPHIAITDLHYYILYWVVLLLLHWILCISWLACGMSWLAACIIRRKHWIVR